jgi:four helix bundle protein
MAQDMGYDDLDDIIIYSDDQDVNEVHDLDSEYDAERDFTSLEAWKKCKEVKLFCYNKVCNILPPEEKYSLNLQIRRAAVSTTANIAEGYGRYHYREGIQFYRISRGSLYELKDHLISCLDFKYITKEIYDEGIGLIEVAKKTLNGYIKFVIHQLNSK